MDIPRDKPQKITIECFDDGTFGVQVNGSKVVNFCRGDCEYWNIDDLARKLYPIKIMAGIKAQEGEEV